MEEQEIDLLEIVSKLWRRRKLILLFMFVFTVIGTGVAFLLPRLYTAKCTLGLELEDKTMRVKVEGLSALQNMNIGDVKEGRVITPGMYPNILYSIPFLKELTYYKLYQGEGKDSVSFYEYYTGSHVQNNEIVQNSGVQNLSEGESSCIAFLRKNVTLDVINKDGCLRLSVDMPNAFIAAQLADKIQQMLQKYITKFKVAKAQAALDFIDERYIDVKRELENRQQELIAFRERNKGRVAVLLGTEEKILMNDYELFFNLYSDIVRQREQAKILVKENMPVLTLIEPVVMPSSPVKPQRGLIILLSIFLGGFVGSGWVLISGSYKNWKLQNSRY